jgi:hypothetical protein
MKAGDTRVGERFRTTCAAGYRWWAWLLWVMASGLAGLRLAGRQSGLGSVWRLSGLGTVWGLSGLGPAWATRLRSVRRGVCARGLGAPVPAKDWTLTSRPGPAVGRCPGPGPTAHGGSRHAPTPGCRRGLGPPTGGSRPGSAALPDRCCRGAQPKCPGRENSTPHAHAPCSSTQLSPHLQAPSSPPLGRLARAGA